MEKQPLLPPEQSLLMPTVLLLAVADALCVQWQRVRQLGGTSRLPSLVADLGSGQRRLGRRQRRRLVTVPTSLVACSHGMLWRASAAVPAASAFATESILEREEDGWCGSSDRHRKLRVTDSNEQNFSQEFGSLKTFSKHASPPTRPLHIATLLDHAAIPILDQSQDSRVVLSCFQQGESTAETSSPLVTHSTGMRRTCTAAVTRIL